MFVHPFLCVSNVFSLPETALMQNIATMTQLLVNLLEGCLIETMEVRENVAPVTTISAVYRPRKTLKRTWWPWLRRQRSPVDWTKDRFYGAWRTSRLHRR